MVSLSTTPGPALLSTVENPAKELWPVSTNRHIPELTDTRRKVQGDSPETAAACTPCPLFTAPDVGAEATEATELGATPALALLVDDSPGTLAVEMP